MTLVSGKEIKYLSIPFREEINKLSPVINVYFYFYIFFLPQFNLGWSCLISTFFSYCPLLDLLIFNWYFIKELIEPSCAPNNLLCDQRFHPSGTFTVPLTICWMDQIQETLNFPPKKLLSAVFYRESLKEIVWCRFYRGVAIPIWILISFDILSMLRLWPPICWYHQCLQFTVEPFNGLWLVSYSSSLNLIGWFQHLVWLN